MICFEDVEVGDELPGLRVVVNAEQVRRFARATNLTDRRFAGDGEARSEGVPGQIIPGNLSMALLSRLVTDVCPAARLRRLGTTFRQFVRPGRQLVARGFVTDKAAGGIPGLITCDLILEDEEGELLVTGTATIELPRREK